MIDYNDSHIYIKVENRNSDQGRSVTPPREVAECNTYYDRTMKMQYYVQEDIVALAQSGRAEERVQEGMRKRRTVGKFMPVDCMLLTLCKISMQMNIAT